MTHRSASENDAVSSGFEKIKVALISVGASLFLIAIKAVVGILTGSLALLAEAAHSGLDFLASLITALSVKAADRPADATHHYGHGKIESLSALFEAALLLAACFWILSEAITRLTSPVEIPRITIYSFMVLLLAIIVDFYRYRALMRTAKKYQSQALEADAIHFYSDILSSSLVIVGLAAVALGYPRADAIAALLIAIWVGVLAIRLGKKNLDILIDRVPEEYIQQIREVVLPEAGVLSIDKLRLRRSGSNIFADLRVAIDRTLSFSEAHDVARILERKLSQQISGLDVVVHMNPAAHRHESLDIGILHFINSEGFQAHHLTLLRDGHQYIAELHLEVSGDKTLGDAHKLATDLEMKLLHQYYEIKSVQIHIEETGGFHQHLETVRLDRPDITEKIKSVCERFLGEGRCHEIFLNDDSGRLAATMHCLFPADLPVREVHLKTTELEDELCRTIPELSRALIHAEPLEHPTR